MELILILLFLAIIWPVYELCYYASDEFKKLKIELHDYTINCNALNEHIEELKETYANIKKTDYGNAVLNDNSRYDFKRSKQVNAKKSEYIHECSASVCKNAETQPFKYLCKYFNIKENEESLSNLENVLNDFSAAEEGKILLKNQLDEIKKSIKYNIPFLIRTFTMRKFMNNLGFKEINFSTLYFPTYTFRYISPGGNKTTSCNICLDITNLNKFVTYLSEVVKFRKSSTGQRALMTSKLRLKIKERDNYTCQSCGNSTYIEPNLLLEIDHIIPISKGGTSTEDNLQTLCWKCNRTKGARLI